MSTTFGIFEILKIKTCNEYFFVFFSMGHNGRKNVKMLLLPHISAKSFHISAQLFCQDFPLKNTIGIFENLSLWSVIIFYIFSILSSALFPSSITRKKSDSKVKFGTRGLLKVHTRGAFVLVLLKVILVSFGALAVFSESLIL